MEKIIWVINKNRSELLDAQRRINAAGSMRTVCLFSFAALEKASEEQNAKGHSRISTPSLILMDYDTLEGEDFKYLSYVKQQPSLAGVPLFVMSDKRSRELDETCYTLGFMVVLSKPITDTGILRLERTAWQHEVTKNYEQLLQKQATDLQAVREIRRLNEQLQARNELLHQIFGRYFSDEVVQVIMDEAKGAVIGGEKRNLTVLISDLRGFTSLSEDLEPEALSELLNYFFEKTVDAITRYHGTILEFVGDGVIAVFGAPLESTEQTGDAIAAAITMQNYMGEVNNFCRKKGYPQLEMGIAIHQGEAFIGNIGSEKMMRYNVIGKVVNECSRIESSSVGGQILVSAEALHHVTCPVITFNRMEVTAKGIPTPIQVYEVSGIEGEYQMSVQNVEFDVMKPVKELVIVHMRLIQDKVVQDLVIPAILVKISCKRAVVELDDFRTGLKQYSDVSLEAYDLRGNVLIEGVSAKVVKRQFDWVVLHFTQVNDCFQEFTSTWINEGSEV